MKTRICVVKTDWFSDEVTTTYRTFPNEIRALEYFNEHLTEWADDYEVSVVEQKKGLFDREWRTVRIIKGNWNW